MEIFDQLKTALKEYGAESRMVSASRIPELRDAYNLSLSGPQLDEQFLNTSIRNYIDFSLQEKYPSIRSVIIVATPSPVVEVDFDYAGSTYSLTIPPHYSDRIQVTGRIREMTSQIFERNGYSTFSVVLPKKLLAARSGLARYGKNNISYVSGMGSYHRLTVFASDLPCVEDSWQDMLLLERCNKCKACLKNCPTAAIRADHFIIRGERCLTHANELLGPFPEWLDAGSHNSIVGCMKCQNICPENLQYSSSVLHKGRFSETETNLILEGPPFEELPADLQLKLNHLSLKRYYTQLARNIRVLMERGSY